MRGKAARPLSGPRIDSAHDREWVETGPYPWPSIQMLNLSTSTVSMLAKCVME